MRNIYILSVLLFGSLFFGCAELDEPQPVNSISTEFAITDRASAKAAINGVYSGLQENSDPFELWMGLAQFFSDETVFTGTFPTQLEFANFNVFPANTSMAGAFTSLYTTINNANNVIALVPGVADDNFTEAARADFIGQARFVRAQCYLHLVTLWKDVPLITTPTVEVGDVLNVPKSSVADIYAQILDDFTYAEANVAAATGPTLASKAAAKAFLARVALYQGNWSTALAKAEEVLGSGFDLTLVPFLQDQLYSLAFSPTDGNSLAFFYGPAEFGGRHVIEPSPSIINAFEPGDSRFAASINLTSASVPFGLKYPSFSAANQGAASDPIFFIRHAEMVLIAAEAAAELGDFTKANAYFNQVRRRAGLDPITLNAGNYVDAILAERFVEFAFEGPFRLIDLRRRGQALLFLGPLGYESCDDVWPLPQREMDRNTNLVQNSCCNC